MKTPINMLGMITLEESVDIIIISFATEKFAIAHILNARAKNYKRLSSTFQQV